MSSPCGSACSAASGGGQPGNGAVRTNVTAWAGSSLVIRTALAVSLLVVRRCLVAGAVNGSAT